MKRGDRFMAYADYPPHQRLFVLVERVARDGSWADVIVQNCYVQWRKRQPLQAGALPVAEPYDWSQADLDAQAREWPTMPPAAQPGEHDGGESHAGDEAQEDA